MTLKHYQFSIPKGSITTANQLRALGVPSHEIKTAKSFRTRVNGHRPTKFWACNVGRERELLVLARECYLKQIVKHHPDKGGDTEIAKFLNVIWGKVERSFRKRGVVLN
jgi:hypothetical protein